MSKLYLTKEEKLTIENNVLKENNFQLQIGILQTDRQQILKDLCKKNSRNYEDIVNVDIQQGLIEFKEPVKSE